MLEKYKYVFTKLLCHEQNATQGQFLSEVQLVWIQVFPSPRLVAALLLHIADVRTDRFMPFPRASRIWTWVADSISYDNSYTTKALKTKYSLKSHNQFKELLNSNTTKKVKFLPCWLGLKKMCWLQRRKTPTT